MKLPLQITFRNLDHSVALAARIQAMARRLERFSPEIIGCRVLVEAPHRRHRKGRPFHVRIDLTIAGGELVVARDARPTGAHADVYVAVRDAFRATRRTLMDYRTRREEVKRHAA